MGQVTKGAFTASKDSGGYNERVQIQVPQNNTNVRRTETFVVKNSDGTKRINIICTQYAQNELITSNINCQVRQILNSSSLRILISSDMGVGNVQLIFNVLNSNQTVTYSRTIDIDHLNEQSSWEIVLQDALSETQVTTEDWDCELVFADTGLPNSQDNVYEYFIVTEIKNE